MVGLGQQLSCPLLYTHKLLEGGDDSSIVAVFVYFSALNIYLCFSFSKYASTVINMNTLL